MSILTKNNQADTVRFVKRPLSKRWTTKAQQKILLTLCCLLLVTCTLSQHLVICTHGDGDTHLELQHIQGRSYHADDLESTNQLTCNCGHRHGDSLPQPKDPSEEDQNPHESCSHTNLLVEVIPQFRFKGWQVGLPYAVEIQANSSASYAWQTPLLMAMPPTATGPPPRRRFLEQLATARLLI